MTVIGIDTAARIGGVAIVGEGRFRGAKVFGIDEGHSEYLLPALESVMDRLGLDGSSVDGIAVSVGPGSFTGLRIGLAVAKSLAYAWDVPLVGVSTLEATAWALRGMDCVVCACLDARRESVYRGIYDTVNTSGDYDSALMLTGQEERVSVTNTVQELVPYAEAGRQIVLVGDGAEALLAAFQKSFPSSNRIAMVPMGAEPQRAIHVAHLGERKLNMGLHDDPFAVVPNYLRRSEAERLWKQRQS